MKLQMLAFIAFRLSQFPGRCCDKIAGPGNLCPDDEQQRGGQEFVRLLIAVICLAIRYL